MISKFKVKQVFEEGHSVKGKNTNRITSKRKILTKMSLGTQLISILIVVGVLPILIGMTSVLTISREMMTDTINIYSTSLIANLNHNLNYAVNEIDTVTRTVVRESAFEKYIRNASKVDVLEYFKLEEEMETEINRVILTDRFLEEVHIYQNGEVLYSNQILKRQANSNYINTSYLITDEFISSELFEEASRENVKWMYIEEPESEGVYISRRLMYMGSDTPSLVIFKLSNDYFNDIIDLIHTKPGIIIRIIDGEGRILFADEEEVVGSFIEDKYKEHIDQIGAADEKVNTITTRDSVIQVARCDNEWVLIVDSPNEVTMEGIRYITLRAITIGLITICIIIFISILVGRRVQSSSTKLLYYMKEVKKGNLDIVDQIEEDVKAPNKDFKYLALGLSDMVSTLRDIIMTSRNTSRAIERHTENVQEIANNTATSSEQVVTAIEGVAKGSVEQAQEIDESVILIKDLSHRISEVDTMTQNVSNASNHTMASSKNAKDKLSILSKQSDENLEMVNHISFNIEKLGEEVSSIRSIIDIIMEINGQTNLLALNAAIEAARAGEKGRGFAVISEEIRKLSLETQKSIIMIEEIVTRIQEQKLQTLQEARKANNRFKEQQPIVKTTEDTFSQIFEEMNAVNKEIEEINVHVNEVKEQKEELLEKLINISAIVQNATGIAEEVTAESEEQTEHARLISKMIDELAVEMKDLNDKFNRFK